MRTSFLTLTVLAGLGLSTAQSTTLSSLSFDTSGLEGQSVTASYFPSSAVSSSGSSSSSSGPAFTTHGPISLTITPSTSASSTSGSSASSSSATSSASATRNAQVKLQAGKQEVVGVVGLMAGVLALIA